MIQIWQVTPTENRKLETDASTLDEVTRQLPEGYYSTFRTFDGGTRVLGLTSHLGRLYQPISTPDVSESVMRRRLSDLLEAYQPGEARVRAVMTRRGQVYLAITPLSPLPREVYEKGVRAETTELQRDHPVLKSTSFIGKSDPERRHIAQQGVFEALLVKEGKIIEGMTSNFFYVIRAEQNERRSGATNAVKAHASTSLVTKNVPPSAQRDVVLCTASDDILLGITRETVIEIARGRGVAVNFQALELSQLETIHEAFITSHL